MTRALALARAGQYKDMQGWRLVSERGLQYRSGMPICYISDSECCAFRGSLSGAIGLTLLDASQHPIASCEYPTPSHA